MDLSALGEGRGGGMGKSSLGFSSKSLRRPVQEDMVEPTEAGLVGATNVSGDSGKRTRDSCIWLCIPAWRGGGGALGVGVLIGVPILVVVSCGAVGEGGGGGGGTKLSSGEGIHGGSCCRVGECCVQGLVPTLSLVVGGGGGGGVPPPSWECCGGG